MFDLELIDKWRHHALPVNSEYLRAAQEFAKLRKAIEGARRVRAKRGYCDFTIKDGALGAARSEVVAEGLPLEWLGHTVLLVKADD